MSLASADAAPRRTRPVRVLRWEAVPGATGYLLEIAADPAFGEVLAREQVTEVYYRWTPPSAQAAYFFRVASVDEQGTPGKFSAAKTIGSVPQAPTPLRPRDGATVAVDDERFAVHIAWSDSPVARYFLLQIGRSASFEGVTPERIMGAPKLEWHPPAVGRFYWRVAAVDSAGTATAYSAPRRLDVSLAPPHATSPASGASVLFLPPKTTVALSVTTHLAERLEILVGTDPKLEAGRIEISGRAAPLSFVASEPGTYYWRARARGSEGPWTAFGPRAVLRLVPPGIVLLAPEEGAVIESDGEPQGFHVRWEPSKNARSYLIEVRPAAAGSPVPPKASKAGTDASGPQIASPPARQDVMEREVHPLALGEYRWRVMGFDANGKPTDASPERTIRIARPASLAAPILAEPQEGANVRVRSPGQPAITFRWQPPAHATAYELELASGARSQTLRAEAPSLAVPVDSIGGYRWRVRGLDVEGKVGPWSEPRRFSASALAVRAELSAGPTELVDESHARAELVVRVFDEDGRPIEGVPLAVRTSSGAVEGLLGDDAGTYRTVWTGASVDADDDTVVSVAGPFALRAEGRLSRPAGRKDVDLGVRLGATSALGTHYAPNAQLQLMVHSPVLSRRLQLHVGLGYSYESQREDGSPALASSLHTMPVDVVVAWAQPLGEATLYAGGGVLTLLYRGSLQVRGGAEQREHGASTGFQALAGGEMALGGIRLFAEAAYGHVPAVDGLFALGGHRLSAGIGVRLGVF